jgi:hypothetical protein
MKATPRKTKSRIRRVNQLMKPDGKSWNETLVNKVRYMKDAYWIVNLKLPVTPCDDLVAWNYETYGIILVKSAYRLA